MRVRADPVPAQIGRDRRLVAMDDGCRGEQLGAVSQEALSASRTPWGRRCPRRTTIASPCFVLCDSVLRSPRWRGCCARPRQRSRGPSGTASEGYIVVVQWIACLGAFPRNEVVLTFCATAP